MASVPAAAAVTRPSVAVVIVAYNSRRFLPDCLDSVARSHYHGRIDIVVVDNASEDGVGEWLAAAHPRARYLRNEQNLGFAAGCNRGIRESTGDFVLLLNPDARLQADTLDILVRHLESRPRVGIVGPRLLTPDGRLQLDASATGTFPSFGQTLFEYTRLHNWFPRHRWWRDYLPPEIDRFRNRRVAMVQGAVFLFRRSLIDEIGDFDEGYFLYFEETDFCIRAAASGWRTYYVGEATAIHIGAHSMPGGRQDADRFIASLYRYHRKHNGIVRAVALWWIQMPYHLARTGRLTLAARRHPDNAKLARDRAIAAARFRAHFQRAVLLPPAAGRATHRGVAPKIPAAGAR